MTEQKRIGRPRSCFCGECKRCKHADYMREYYRRASIEKRREWIAGRNPRSVAAAELRRSAKRLRDPEFRRRERIRQQTRRALSNGLIQRGPCVRCGSEKNVQAHHESYSRPLDVTWLCPMHHAERHVERAAEQAA